MHLMAYANDNQGIGGYKRVGAENKLVQYYSY